MRIIEYYILAESTPINVTCMLKHDKSINSKCKYFIAYNYDIHIGEAHTLEEC